MYLSPYHTKTRTGLVLGLLMDIRSKWLKGWKFGAGFRCQKHRLDSRCKTVSSLYLFRSKNICLPYLPGHVSIILGFRVFDSPVHFFLIGENTLVHSMVNGKSLWCVGFGKHAVNEFSLNRKNDCVGKTSQVIFTKQLLPNVPMFYNCIKRRVVSTNQFEIQTSLCDTPKHLHLFLLSAQVYQ